MRGAVATAALLVWALAAVVLPRLAAAQNTDAPRFAVRNFVVEGDNPLAEDTTHRLLAPYAGQSQSLERLQEAARALEAALAEAGFRFHRVVLVPQPVEGTVRLRVVSFRVGTVAVTGNQHFSTPNVRAGLPTLREGEAPNVSEIARNRALVNEHSAKNVEITFRRGAAPDTVDASVEVRDERPLQGFAVLTNAGSPATGDWRATLGVQHANLFDRDHALTATYSTSPGHWDDVRQYGFFYRLPLYAAGASLTAYYSYSDVSSGTVAEFFQVSGRGRFYGLRWNQHFAPRGAYAHSIELGWENRYFVNDVSFGGQPLGVNVRSAPFSARYNATLEGSGRVLRGSIEFAANVRTGQDNTDAAYAGNRAAADARWRAFRYTLEGQSAFGAWIGSARLRGQAAGESLIAGEQFGFGGAAGVRGLQEREATGDSGYALTLELLSPALAEGLRGVVFADTARSRLHNAAAGQVARLGAASAGAGVRWRPQRGVALSADLARILNGATTTRAGHSRLHVALNLSF